MCFQRAHLDLLLGIAEAESDGANCREVQFVDVFFDESVFAEAK